MATVAKKTPPRTRTATPVTTVTARRGKRGEAGAPTEDSERVEHGTPLTFDRPHAEVEFRVGTTRELGQYEFVRLDIAVRMPCAVEDVDATINELSTRLAERLYEEEQQYLPT